MNVPSSKLRLSNPSPQNREGGGGTLDCGLRVEGLSPNSDDWLKSFALCGLYAHFC